MSSDRTRTHWWIVTVQVALLIAIVLVPAADDWPTPGWLLVLTSVLTLGGMVIVVTAMFGLVRRLASAGPAGRAAVQTDGLYRWVRHPVYSGVVALATGVAIRSGNVIAAVLAVVIVVFFHRKAAWEEAQLRERSPAYDAYASVTPRFLPRPGGRSVRH